MNMRSNAFISRLEVFFYSIIITCLGGINQLRTRMEHKVTVTSQALQPPDTNLIIGNDATTPKAAVNGLVYVSQVLTTLLIWMILGFAAGFLLGMINPR